jgi:DNA-binding response OmpR family regulator
MPVPPLASPRPSALHALRTRPEALRVFICDDDLVFADELASALTASSFEARTLRDGKTPIEIFELFAPDIVLLDIFMPPPDGFEMMNHIAQNIRHKHVSLALMSGADHNQLETATHFCTGRGLTPAAVLQKPVRLADILSVCMSHRRRPRSIA